MFVLLSREKKSETRMVPFILDDDDELFNLLCQLSIQSDSDSFESSIDIENWLEIILIDRTEMITSHHHNEGDLWGIR